jgi:hypothetical protein
LDSAHNKVASQPTIDGRRRRHLVLAQSLATVCLYPFVGSMCVVYWVLYWQSGCFVFHCLFVSLCEVFALWVCGGHRHTERQRQTKSFFCTKWVVIESDEDRDVGGWGFLPCVFCRVPDLDFFLPPMAMLQWE